MQPAWHHYHPAWLPNYFMYVIDIFNGKIYFNFLFATLEI